MKDPDRLHKGAIDDNYRLRELLPEGWEKTPDLPVTAEARNSFRLAYGMDYKDQLQLERALEAWNFDLGRTREGEGVDLESWLFSWLKPEEW